MSSRPSRQRKMPRRFEKSELEPDIPDILSTTKKGHTGGAGPSQPPSTHRSVQDEGRTSSPLSSAPHVTDDPSAEMEREIQPSIRSSTTKKKKKVGKGSQPRIGRSGNSTKAKKRKASTQPEGPTECNPTMLSNNPATADDQNHQKSQKMSDPIPLVVVPHPEKLFTNMGLSPEKRKKLCSTHSAKEILAMSALFDLRSSGEVRPKKRKTKHSFSTGEEVGNSSTPAVCNERETPATRMNPTPEVVSPKTVLARGKQMNKQFSNSEEQSTKKKAIDHGITAKYNHGQAPGTFKGNFDAKSSGLVNENVFQGSKKDRKTEVIRIETTAPVNTATLGSCLLPNSINATGKPYAVIKDTSTPSATHAYVQHTPSEPRQGAGAPPNSPADRAQSESVADTITERSNGITATSTDPTLMPPVILPSDEFMEEDNTSNTYPQTLSPSFSDETEAEYHISGKLSLDFFRIAAKVLPREQNALLVKALKLSYLPFVNQKGVDDLNNPVYLACKRIVWRDRLFLVRVLSVVAGHDRLVRRFAKFLPAGMRVELSNGETTLMRDGSLVAMKFPNKTVLDGLVKEKCEDDYNV